jgi:hypothetical protein
MVRLRPGAPQGAAPRPVFVKAQPDHLVEQRTALTQEERMKVLSTVFASTVALLLVAAPAFAEGAGGDGGGAGGASGTGGSSGMPGTPVPGTLSVPGTATTTPCVGANCPSGGAASPNTGGLTTPMTQNDCLNGGWERAGLSSAAACFSAPNVSR